MIRLIVVDDHPIVRQGLQRLLEHQPDMRVVREAADGRQALLALQECECDVLLLDLSLPRVNGMEVLRRAQAALPAVRVVVLSMFPPNEHEARLKEMGAAAYVAKDAPPEELLKAIRAVAAGEPFTSAASKRRAATGVDRAPHKNLTAREHQVFTLLYQGLTVTEIAAELDVSASTVSNHVAKIREKLGVHSIADIVRYAHEAGIAGRSPARRPPR